METTEAACTRSDAPQGGAEHRRRQQSRELSLSDGALGGATPENGGAAQWRKRRNGGAQHAGRPQAAMGDCGGTGGEIRRGTGHATQRTMARRAALGGRLAERLNARGHHPLEQNAYMYICFCFVCFFFVFVFFCFLLCCLFVFCLFCFLCLFFCFFCRVSPAASQG